MTRKEALQAAKRIIQQTELEDKYKEEIISKLELCESELPFAKWSEAAIFDACDQYCKEAGRNYLRMDDFQKRGLPSHSAIKNRFGMTAAEFRNAYYPIPHASQRKSKTNQERTEQFIRCYKELNPSSADEYNRRRPKGAFLWQTIAKIHEVQTWRQLLQKFDLSYQPKITKYTVTCSSQSGAVEYIKNVIQAK